MGFARGFITFKRIKVYHDLNLITANYAVNAFSIIFLGDIGVNTYRIPIITSLPDGSLIGMSEGRKHSSADSGPKFLAMRRSKDQGITWSNTTFIEDDGEDPDGLNLGTVFVDEDANRVFVVYSYCAHKCVYHTTYLISSDDFGDTWSKPSNLSDQIGTSLFAPGPGFGIQVMGLSATAFYCIIVDEVAAWVDYHTEIMSRANNFIVLLVVLNFLSNFHRHFEKAKNLTTAHYWASHRLQRNR